jgi:hypothetical protein
VILRADISEMQGGDDRFVPRTNPLRTIKGEGARAGKFPAKNLGAVAREICWTLVFRQSLFFDSAFDLACLWGPEAFWPEVWVF